MSRRALATFLIALFAAGCGSGDEAPPPADESPTRLTVQETAGVPAAFVAFAIERGAFSDQGLAVRLETTQGGAATIPALLSGDVEVGGSNVVSLLLAASKGLPVRAIAGGTTARAAGEPDFGVLVAAGKRAPRDLEGATIAVNTLNNVAEVAVKAALEKRAVDPDSLEFTAVPFGGMQDALEGGSVDAAFAIEPFATEIARAGHAVIGYAYVETEPGMQVGAYAVADSFAEAEPEAVDAFRAAIEETAAHVGEHEDEFRSFLSEREDVPAELSEDIVLPLWTGRLDRASVENSARLMRRYGLVERPIDTGRLLQSG